MNAIPDSLLFDFSQPVAYSGGGRVLGRRRVSGEGGGSFEGLKRRRKAGGGRSGGDVGVSYYFALPSPNKVRLRG